MWASPKKTLIFRLAYWFLNVILFTTPVNNHVEAGLVLVKRPEETRAPAEDDCHAVDHGLVEVAEAETRLLLSVMVGKQIEAFVERVDYCIFLLKSTAIPYFFLGLEKKRVHAILMEACRQPQERA